MRVSTVLHNFLREEYSEMESTSSDRDARELTSADAALQSLGRCSGREAMEAMGLHSCDISVAQRVRCHGRESGLEESH